ncbi:galactosyl transferase GMA12/MNN10 family-domain-containing protein [Sphaerosporella brunnea]|uniref:Galactosyl transferase GMA12/MNN10 family-domain-containing protein n=1 Tax=Sphaerosporella brunnea TaxID=1250544 RepID=A0A5J5EZL7_9PEZI|nr:galactosyl transferase GMA12/MNN10 family-domain-containing protein [Sphaerosporella brunnea]
MLPTSSSPTRFMRPRSRGSAHLVIILVLVIYIVYLHTNGSPYDSLSRSQLVPFSRRSTSAANRHVLQSQQMVLTTDKSGWASTHGKAGASIYQRPLTPVPKGDMRIAIASMNTMESTYDHISLSGKFGYATKHNYGIKMDLAVPKGFRAGAVWHKLNMVEYLVRTGDYDWIWWIDYDTVITNTTVKLEDIIAEALHSEKVKSPQDIHMILTADCWPLNAGSMLLRSTPLMLEFLSDVWKCGDTEDDQNRPNEQSCILDVIEAKPFWKSRAMWIPQTKINAFPSEISCFDKHQKGWTPGDFVVHFPGAWAHLQDIKDPYGVLMRKYNEWVEYVHPGSLFFDMGC